MADGRMSWKMGMVAGLGTDGGKAGGQSVMQAAGN